VSAAVTEMAAPMLVEEPFFDGEGDARLFGFLHHPAGKPRGTVVFCHALAEEKLWSHRVYVTFARELAQAGFGVLRFDVRGEGDSGTDFESSTVETRIEDTMRAISLAQSRLAAMPPVLVGHRFGGSIALATAVRAAGDVKAVAVWDPLSDGAEYFAALLRSNLTTQMAVHGKVTRTREALIKAILEGETVVADGYGLGPELYRGMSSLSWSAQPGFFAHPTLLLEVPTGGRTEPSEALATLAAQRPRLTVKIAAEPPFWRETRQFHRRAGAFGEATLAWLETLT
jgi:pimeloyl-ACP methyl ester carboxylesterase